MLMLKYPKDLISVFILESIWLDALDIALSSRHVAVALPLANA
jgi:hypothetical protein